MAQKEPYRQSKWADVSPLLKYISGAVTPHFWAAEQPFTRDILNVSKGAKGS